MKRRTRTIKPLPFAVYFWTVAALAATGLLDALYLSVSHYRNYTDFAYQSFCAISRAINCDTVSQSPYAIFAGVPVAVWGTLGYLFFLYMLLFVRLRGKSRLEFWLLIQLTAALFSGIGILLALVSTFFIKSYCIMCIASYGINFSLLFFGWLTWKRFSKTSWTENFKRLLRGVRSDILVLFLPPLILSGAAMAGYPEYWNLAPPALSSDLPQGMTADGHPWIGAVHPQLEIAEFTDYQCFQCKKMHFFLRQLVAGNPGKIRLVHYHFPMDDRVNPIVKEPFHRGSAKMALLAVAAAQKGRFWKMNDLLFSLAKKVEKISLSQLAEDTGIEKQVLLAGFTDPEIRRHLANDLKAGLDLGVTGTPTFLIDGRVYVGYLPREIIGQFIDTKDRK